MTKALSIRHVTTYRYNDPVPFGLQQVRLTPKQNGGQTIRDWSISVDGGKVELSYDDPHMNHVTLISFEPGTTEVTITCEGTVIVEDTHGIVGNHSGFVPGWLYKQPTPLTKIGPGVRALSNRTEGETGSLAWLHGLSANILEMVEYRAGESDTGTTAEEAVATGYGVCQDHAHIFIACCRHAGLAARYVSGYLMMDDRTHQNATHAWAEVLVDGLGWVGFDVSNGMSPDSRYVRVATGLDYADAAPISGTRSGTAGEVLSVQLQVQQ